MGEGRRCKSLLLYIAVLVTIQLLEASNETVSQTNRRGKALNISKKLCTDPSGQKGVCTFKWDCIRQNGTKIATCMDSFIVGTCCLYSHDSEDSLYSSNVDDEDDIDSNELHLPYHKPFKDSFDKPAYYHKPSPAASTTTVISTNAAQSTSTTTTSVSSTTPQLVTWSSISPSKISNHKRPMKMPALLFSSGIAYPNSQSVWPSGIAYPVNQYRPNRPLHRPMFYNTYYSSNFNKITHKNEVSSNSNFTIFNTDKNNKTNYLPVEKTTISVPIAQWMSTKTNTNAVLPIASAINRLPVPTVFTQGFNIQALTTSTASKPSFSMESNNLTEFQNSKPATSTQVPKKKPVLDYRKDCGVRVLAPRARIVGGMSAYFGKWPWQILVKEAAWLGLYHKNKCGGVLISSKYAITAGHCQPGFLSSLVVLLGEYDLTVDLEVLKPEMRRVKRMVVHRHYNPQNFDNDIAILELDPPVVFKPHISPICLPEKDEDFTGRMAYVTGWGKTLHGGAIPNLLQEVQVPIVSNTKCLDMFKVAGHNKVIKDNFLCAGYESGGKDSCEGDSGGPLMVQRNDSRWVLAGTVSHGIRCADPNLPGVYMRMATYRPWIDKIMESK